MDHVVRTTITIVQPNLLSRLLNISYVTFRLYDQRQFLEEQNFNFKMTDFLQVATQFYTDIQTFLYSHTDSCNTILTEASE